MSPLCLADMGSRVKGKIGYDSNAWVWESGNIVRNILKISIYNVNGYASIIRDIMRYM